MMSRLTQTMKNGDSKYIITLFGKKAEFKDLVGRMILKEDPLHHPVNTFVKTTDDISLGANKTFKVVCTGDIFEEHCLHPDQQIIDCMALSHPGPHLFILAIHAEHNEEGTVVDQIDKLRGHFGERFTSNLVVLLPSIEVFQALSHLGKQSNIQFATANEYLSSTCEQWCSDREPFLYEFTNYSGDVVKRRMRSFNKQSSLNDNYRRNEPPPYHDTRIGNSASVAPDNIFNIILLGQTGTGKSASGNTILAAGNSKSSKKSFKSEANSVPVTKQCEVIKAKKLHGVQVMVVDTPDFFNELTDNPQRHIEECKSYFVSGRYAVLLVIQVGRFTDGERGILEKLEKKLDCKIRDQTTVLLTHAEDLEGCPKAFIDSDVHLKRTVDMCGNRFHLFKNKSKEPQQVKELIEKIPFFAQINRDDPKGESKNKRAPECCLC
ncbi:GTPase IMAP family member 8-like isoform 2-T2 [Odontesthes bonariensis]|uniref:GTPase IMAP family member 8-like isoform X2 n=1 Tax=Odontesthes bonariensis TaxID=219752 RepID=UPI003F58E314